MPLGWCASGDGRGSGASATAQCLARLSARWARLVRAWPRPILAVGLLVAAAAAACNLAHVDDAMLLDAWLPRGGWRNRDKATSERTWGAQRLDQIIVRPLPGATWSSARPESQDEMAAALSFLHALSATLVAETATGNATTYSDVCFQPAQPYVPGCLTYSPLAWWSGSVDAFASDPAIWDTLAAPTAAGGVRGLEVARSDVLSVVVDTEQDGSVSEVKAMMLWLFVDVAPQRVTPGYLARAAAYERALLRSTAAARTNHSLPFNAYGSISSSVQSEIQSSAAADVNVVIITVGALFVFHLVVLCAMDYKRWVSLHL